MKWDLGYFIIHICMYVCTRSFCVRPFLGASTTCFPLIIKHLSRRRRRLCRWTSTRLQPKWIVRQGILFIEVHIASILYIVMYNSVVQRGFVRCWRRIFCCWHQRLSWLINESRFHTDLYIHILKFIIDEFQILIAFIWDNICILELGLN